MKIEKLEKMQAEHEVHGAAETWREGVALFEIAIQLKRIADAMEIPNLTSLKLYKLAEEKRRKEFKERQEKIDRGGLMPDVMIDGVQLPQPQPLAVGDEVIVDNPGGEDAPTKTLTESSRFKWCIWKKYEGMRGTILSPDEHQNVETAKVLFATAIVRVPLVWLKKAGV